MPSASRRGQCNLEILSTLLASGCAPQAPPRNARPLLVHLLPAPFNIASRAMPCDDGRGTRHSQLEATAHSTHDALLTWQACDAHGTPVLEYALFAGDDSALSLIMRALNWPLHTPDSLKPRHQPLQPHNAGGADEEAASPPIGPRLLK